jgi:hypothetical protein
VRFACGLSALSMVVSLVHVLPARADALRNVERTSSGGGSSSRSSSRSSSHSASWSDDEDDDDDDLGVLFLYLTYKLMASPWQVPRLYDDPRLERYALYPYADGPGLLRQNDDELLGESRKVAVQMDVESGYQLQGVVPGSFALRVQLPRRFELSSRVSLLSDLRETPVERAVSTTTHVLYRHAQTSRAEFRSGLGVRSFTFNEVSAGVDFMYAIDAYLSRWSVLRIEMHLGSLGRAFAGEARATLGIMVKRCELYAGYDQTVFSGNGTTRLGGPIAGLRAWF